MVTVVSLVWETYSTFLLAIVSPDDGGGGLAWSIM